MKFNENFLHFIWQHKLFESRYLQCTDGSTLVIKNVGKYTQLSGPDFSEAHIYIAHQLWVGSVEIHKQSSEWYDHQHHLDSAYNNVILHVVWEDNQIIYDQNNRAINTLCLKPYVSKILLDRYQQLMADKSWIYCENQLKDLPEIVKVNTFESVFIERLSEKIKPFETSLNSSKGDWEKVLFQYLMKAFGLNINGESFFEISNQINFDWIKKERHQISHLEALFYGQTQILNQNHEDQYFKTLKRTHEFLKGKYQCNRHLVNVHFYKLRPDNFPTIRLAQLAQLYHQAQHVFESLIKTDLNATKNILKTIHVSDYWQTHYVFDKVVSKRKHHLSDAFIELLLINVILPMKFFYFQNQCKDLSDEIISDYAALKKEKNSIIDKFDHHGLPAENALESQALVHLKKHYCEKRQCLHCVIGKHLMGKAP
jgi:hypothetical protein